MTQSQLDTAILAGGCFWCIEAVFLDVQGVVDAESGYAGGERPNPTYQEVCNGDTGHAEVVKVTYNPEEITYADLLRIFFSVHDPTTLNRQGADVGTQYRSAIFPLSDTQEATARAVIQEIDTSGIWDAPLVTTIETDAEYYKAEAYHQRFFMNNPEQGYCTAVVRPKVLKFRKQFADRLKPGVPQSGPAF